MAVFLYETVNCNREVVLANSSPIKLLRINFDDNDVLLPASSINVGFSTNEKNFHG